MNSEKPMKILLIEANPNDVLIIQKMLSEIKGTIFNIESADRLSVGLERLDQKDIDTALLDLSLPDSQGIDTLTRILDHTDDVPIIVITDLDNETVGIEAIQKGAQGYLVKGELNSTTLFRSLNHAIERKILEVRLCASKERFHKIIEENADGIIVVDKNGITRFVNPAAEALFGRKEDELIGDAFGFPIGSDEAMEMDILHKSGKSIVADMRVVEIDWEVENAYLATLRDVTERKHMEEELRIKDNAIESSTNAIVITDLDGNLTYVNPNFLKIWGYDDKEILSRPIAEIFTTEEITKFIEDLQSKGYWLGELVAKRKNKTVFDVQVSASTITDKEDRQNGMIISIIDITERKFADKQIKKTLNELERSNKELEQFAYVASHDLQEPLRKIRSFTELLAERIKDKLDEKTEMFMYYITNGVERMQALINDLLTYSRVNTQAKPFKLTSIESILSDSISNLQIMIKQAGAEITCDALPMVKVDKSQLTQVFQNLISNSIKFQTEDKPRIHISARGEMDVWNFSVRDNGIGIEPQYNERIFEIFQRLHPKDNYPGTGIGLAVCKKIIERHDGKIWMDSEPGKGSTFYFTIPKLQDNGEKNCEKNNH